MRLGEPKQLVRVGGQPLLRRVVGAAVAATRGDSVFVVLGAHAARITPLLKNSSASVIINRDWEEGLASSIRCGLKSLGAGAEAALIVLGDQYALTSVELRRLIDAWQGRDAAIAASRYNAQLGVPAIFPRGYFGELMELRGDQGAKLLIKRHANRVVSVPMPSAAIDLDTPEDLQRLGPA